MKILFTGASSFTGYWFAKELVEAGHKVVTTYTKLQPKDYAGIRGERVTKLYNKCEQVFSCKFGTSKFLELIRSESQWDMICHHAADVSDYKSSKFDFVNALKQNTFNLPSVFDTLLKKNCRTVILTGSVFENDEGKGDDDLRAFSPYGLSKGLTFNVFEILCPNIQLKTWQICNT